MCLVFTSNVLLLFSIAQLRFICVWPIISSVYLSACFSPPSPLSFSFFSFFSAYSRQSLTAHDRLNHVNDSMVLFIWNVIMMSFQQKKKRNRKRRKSSMQLMDRQFLPINFPLFVTIRNAIVFGSCVCCSSNRLSRQAVYY